jgi:hypothetical protein
MADDGKLLDRYAMADIVPGELYWFELDHFRIRLKAVWPSDLPGWWICRTEEGQAEMMIREMDLEPSAD